MSLGRAKTILIFAFLGLNLFLCYHLFGEEARGLTWAKITAGELRHVERRLAEQGYRLETKLDRSIRKSSFLTVAPYREVEQFLRKGLAVTGAPAAALKEGIGIDVSPGGAMRVEFTPGERLLEGEIPAAERDLPPAFELFLRDRGLAFPKARFDHLTRSGGRTILHYVQLFEGRPLYSGYLRAELENNTLRAVELYWLKPETLPQEREMEVIPVTEALLRLSEVLGPVSRTRSIIKADLGFYSHEYDASSWEVPPVWRFLFEDGESCYVNAFTGNLELEISN